MKSCCEFNFNGGFNVFFRFKALFLSVLLFQESSSFAKVVPTCDFDAVICDQRAVRSFYVAARMIPQMMIGCSTETSFGKEPVCKLDSAERNLLQKMATRLNSGHEVVSLDFRSEAEEPGFFFLDGQVRIAKTGSELKSVVFVNLDVLNNESFGVADAVAILVHELGHHQKMADHQFLDRLGAKVRAFTERYQVTANFFTTWDQEIEVRVFNAFGFWHRMSEGPHFKANGQVVVWDGRQYHDLTVDLLPVLCSAQVGLKTTDFGVQNLLFDHSSEKALSLRLAASYVCMPGFGFGQNHFDQNWSANLQFVQDAMGGWRLREEAPEWSAKHCAGDRDLPCW